MDGFERFKRQYWVRLGVRLNVEVEGRREVVFKMSFKALSWSAEWIMAHRCIKELVN